MSKKTAIQLGRFLCIGVLNTALDLAVLNVLIFSFGITAGLYPIFKGIGFLVAVINSYVWNKYWAFSAGDATDSIFREQGSFLLISGLGFFLNNVSASAVFVFLSHVSVGLSSVLIANAAAIVGTLCVLIFNFVGYKFVVFKQHSYE